MTGRSGQLPPVGTRGRYRFWESEEFRVGTITQYWRGVLGTFYVDIERDGYRETAVMRAENVLDAALWIAE